MEHNKQNDWQSREFFLEGNALANSSYGVNGIPGSGSGGGGVGGRFNNGNYWNDNNRYISKKVNLNLFLNYSSELFVKKNTNV